MAIYRKFTSSALHGLIRAGLLLLAASSTQAQLYGDYQARDNHADHPVNVYFGTAKNAAGEYLEGTTIVLSTEMLDFVAVTDARGRFRIELPVDISPQQVQARCSRRDYPSSSIRRRLPRGGKLSPVEINCQLQT